MTENHFYDGLDALLATLKNPASVEWGFSKQHGLFFLAAQQSHQMLAKASSISAGLALVIRKYAGVDARSAGKSWMDRALREDGLTGCIGATDVILDSDLMDAAYNPLIDLTRPAALGIARGVLILADKPSKAYRYAVEGRQAPLIQHFVGAMKHAYPNTRNTVFPSIFDAEKEKLYYLSDGKFIEG